MSEKLYQDSLSEIQTFTVDSGVLRVTDPCYSPDTWCAGKLEGVKIGRWLAMVAYQKDEFDMTNMQEWREKCVKSIADWKAKGEEEYAFLIKSEQDILENIERNIEAYNGRVSRIHVAHESYALELEIDELSDAYEKSGIDVGVDSGQAGFFDAENYGSLFINNGGKHEECEVFEAFYKDICDKTLSKDQFGAVEFGVASSSGYGDGGYDCYFKRDEAGEVIAATIIFIGKEAMEDDELEEVE